MTKRIAVPKLLPVDQPAPFTPLIVGAAKALEQGTATDHQQKSLCEWLIKSAAGIATPSFRAGDPYATAFAEGRRFVGIQMMMLLQQKESDNG